LILGLTFVTTWKEYKTKGKKNREKEKSGMHSEISSMQQVSTET
jgi:hypothetical protein